MSDRFVPDTHALFFYLTDLGKLGRSAKEVFDQFDDGQAILTIPWIIIAELFWIAQKLTTSMDSSSEFRKLWDHPRIEFVGLDYEQVLNFPELDKVKEMHDRIIVGVAYKFGLPLITRDGNITESHYVETIWS